MNATAILGPFPSGGWQRLQGNRLALSGLVLVAALATLALAAPVLPLADPYAIDLGQRLLPIGAEGHLLGTDQLGRDLLSRLVWGTRASLAVGFFAVLLAALAGTLIGLLAGYARGWPDNVMMRGIDVLLAFPYLLLALAIVAVLGPGLSNAMIAVAVANVPFFARTVRGTVVGLTERGFVDAARLTGASGARMLFSELLPNVLQVVVIMMSTNLGWMILETAGLSFLGLGAQPPLADLGSMLGTGREFLTTVPHVAILPGAVILLLAVGINLIGDGLRDLLDPRRRGGSDAGLDGRAAQPDSLAAGAPSRPAACVALLRVEALTTRFIQHGGRHRAVDAVSFSLHPGERLAVVGESGCGKTVMALSVLGLVPEPGRVVGGRVLFRGEDLLRASEPRRRSLRGGRIAYIPQDPMTALNPVLTIGSQLVEAIRAHQAINRKAAHARAVVLLERVSLTKATERMAAYPHELSGGERQRVLIAMALANEPALIIADEPTTALDVTVQADILKLLDGLCTEHDAALLLISHDPGVVAQLCDRVLVLYAGRVVEDGPTGALLSRPAHPYTRALLACAPEFGRPDKVLTAIPGQPPLPDDLPRGCLFAPRCAHAVDRCRAAPITLRRFDDERRVRCIRAGELEPWKP